MASKPEEKINNYWFMMQILAAGRSLAGDDEYAFRRITREYSEKYNTPLAEVRKMPFNAVLGEVLEGRLDTMSRKNLMNFIKELLSDGSSEAKALEERMRKYEEEEKTRLETAKTRKPKRKKQKIVFSGTSEAAPQVVPQIQKTYSMGDPDKE